MLINCCPCLFIKDRRGGARERSRYTFRLCVVQSEDFESMFCYQQSKNSEHQLEKYIEISSSEVWTLTELFTLNIESFFPLIFPVNLLHRNFHQKSNQIYILGPKPDTFPNACSTLCWMKMNTAACCSNMFRNTFCSRGKTPKRFSQHTKDFEQIKHGSIEKYFVSAPSNRSENNSEKSSHH